MTTPAGANESRVTEDQFLGALLGMAIGDALGVPVRGLTAPEIQARHGEIAGYATPPVNGAGGGTIGEISDKTEIVLCLVESLTTNDGMIDAENINARLMFLLNGPSRELLSPRTAAGIEEAAAHGGLVAVDGGDAAELAVATRGVPIGLLHAVGLLDAGSLAGEARLVTRLSHAGEAAAQPTEAVALLVAAAARRPDDLIGWYDGRRDGAGGSLVDDLRAMAARVATAATFEAGVYAVVAEGGETDSRGAIAGAIAGARFGASGIPQHLIDDLDARIYLTLAAPWFYRAALRRQGTVIDLRTVQE